MRFDGIENRIDVMRLVRTVHEESQNTKGLAESSSTVSCMMFSSKYGENITSDVSQDSGRALQGHARFLPYQFPPRIPASVPCFFQPPTSPLMNISRTNS